MILLLLALGLFTRQLSTKTSLCFRTYSFFILHFLSIIAFPYLNPDPVSNSRGRIINSSKSLIPAARPTQPDYANPSTIADGMTPTRASSTSVYPPSVQPERRDWRRFSGYSVTSPIEPLEPRPPARNGQSPTVTEEINEVKRYEDFTTIDWVQDAVHDHARRKAKRRERSGFWDTEGTFGWRRKMSESYDAGQAWLVITLVGAAIGLNSAFLNIITEWLSDVKLGYCTTAFYLNEQFCCWGAEGGMLRYMRLWTEAHYVQDAPNGKLGLPSGLSTMLCISSLRYAPDCRSMYVSDWIDALHLYRCPTCQVVCPIRGWIRYIRDQMYYRGLCHEGISRRLDAVDQVDHPSIGYCVGTLGWERGPECAFCCLYRECDFSLLQQIQTKCVENQRGLDSNCGRRRCSRIRQSNWWRDILTRGTLILLDSSEC